MSAVKQDLSWLKTVFGTYIHNLETAWDNGADMHPEELKYKRQAANELLDEIKDFIKQANKLQGVK